MKTVKSSATLALQVSNPYGVVCFEDLATEMQKHFNVEKDAKNKTYSYILSKGLLKDFSIWQRGNNYDNPHEACLRHIELLTPHEN